MGLNIDIDNINISDSLYIGIRGEGHGKAQTKSKGFDKKNYPLSFVTYFDKDDASFRGRKSTVVSWAGANGYHDYLDNDSQEGFKIVDYATRYSTSNKLFEVQDPRGFTLQISAENIVFLILTCDIHKGVIQTPCVWARRRSDNFLVPTECKAFAKGIKRQKNISIRDVNPGDIVETKSQKNIIYLGYLHVGVSRLEELKTADQVNAGHYRSYTRYSTVGYKPEHVELDDKYHVFIPEDQLDPKNRNDWAKGRSKFADAEIIITKTVNNIIDITKKGNALPYDLKSLTGKNNMFRISNSLKKAERTDSGEYRCTLRASIFETKEDLETFDFKPIEQHLKQEKEYYLNDNNKGYFY